MKPKLAHLECLGYWVTELAVNANLGRDTTASSSLSFEDVQIEADAVLDPDSGHWRVWLSVRQDLPATRNAAYSFAISLLGHFRVSADYHPADRAEQLVRTNAPSVLYSAAREVLRAAMSAGPYPPILLPTAWFYVPPPELPKSEPPSPGIAPQPTTGEIATKPTRRKGSAKRTRPPKAE